MSYIRVGRTDFPVEQLKTTDLETLKAKYYYLNPKVVELAFYQVNPKAEDKPVAKPTKRKPRSKKK